MCEIKLKFGLIFIFSSKILAKIIIKRTKTALNMNQKNIFSIKIEFKQIYGQ